MKQYIDKSAVVAEIESKRKYAQHLGDNAINGSMQQFYDGMKQGCVDILSFLDTLEVKEVDLDKHLKEDIEDTLFDLNGVAVIGATHYLTVDDVKEIAKHFFELGIKAAQKGEDV